MLEGLAHLTEGKCLRWLARRAYGKSRQDKAEEGKEGSDWEGFCTSHRVWVLSLKNWPEVPAGSTEQTGEANRFHLVTSSQFRAFVLAITSFWMCFVKTIPRGHLSFCLKLTSLEGLLESPCLKYCIISASGPIALPCFHVDKPELQSAVTLCIYLWPCLKSTSFNRAVGFRRLGDFTCLIPQIKFPLSTQMWHIASPQLLFVEWRSKWMNKSSSMSSFNYLPK